MPSGSLVRTPSSRVLLDFRTPARKVRLWEVMVRNYKSCSKATPLYQQNLQRLDGETALDWRRRFFGLRIDCERVPRLPAPIVRRILADPDWNRYQLIWLNEWTGVIEDLVWVKRVVAPRFPNVEAIAVECPGKSTTDIHLFQRSPRQVGLPEIKFVLGPRRTVQLLQIKTASLFTADDGYSGNVDS